MKFANILAQGGSPQAVPVQRGSGELPAGGALGALGVPRARQGPPSLGPVQGADPAIPTELLCAELSPLHQQGRESIWLQENK